MHKELESELRRRFTTKNVSIMKALHCCSPASSHFLDLVHPQPLVDTHSLDKCALESELPLVKRTLAKKTMQGTSGTVIIRGTHL